MLNKNFKKDNYIDPVKREFYSLKKNEIGYKIWPVIPEKNFLKEERREEKEKDSHKKNLFRDFLIKIFSFF
jgi:hypothetical protein